MEGKEFEKLDTVEVAEEVSAELQEVIKTEAELFNGEASGEKDFTPERADRVSVKKLGFLTTSFLALSLSMPGIAKAADVVDIFRDLIKSGGRIVERAQDARGKIELEQIKKQKELERDRIKSEVELEKEQQRTRQQEIREGAGITREQIKERGGLNRERARKGQPIPAESRSDASGPYGNTSTSVREGALGSTGGGAEVSPEVKKALMDAGRTQAEVDYKASADKKLFVKADAHLSWTQGYVTRWLELKEMEKSKK
ncbi:hypothetical protein A2Z53_01165 [Candidatus Giovannonibacteria bacterium RIFCSPHIGHO2_02_42_15]|uniref:Uncharacterized protein n=1 Tax=Candidatus Giovannonibacteria bacterium RIFCSPHIGHO2_02_42_15 TaxID=1798329 RepID=A0A1F5VKZ3_9BACT|nr:MAG: hypothetical protein A2Z53_01165 [Candidatus Giovannonibacteria bacterium RIFCSPHIGHO2_02_42_15]